MKNKDQIAYMLSFLQIIIDRHFGGEITLTNLSDYAGTAMNMETDLDTEEDRVTIKVVRMRKGNGE